MFFPSLSLKISSQHQISTAVSGLVWENRATLPLPRSWLRSPTSTPKPRAEGSSPSAPAKNREASTMLASLFFVSAHKDSATRCGCALRSACRGASACQWHASYEPTEAAAETKSFCPCQKSQVSLLRYLTFSLACSRIWQQGAAAGPPAVRVVGACSPVGCVQAPVSAPASVGAERSPPGSSTRGGSRDKSFCPCQKTGGNTGFSPVFFLPVLHGFVVHFGSDTGFSHLV